MSEIDLKQLDNNVLLSEVKNRLIDGRMALEKAGGELESAGLILSKSIEEIKIKNATFEKEREAIFNELKELNITTIEGLINYIQENKQKAKDTKDKEEFDKNYSDILKEKGLLKDGKPTGAMYEVVNKWAGCKIGMTKGEMTSCIDKVLNDEHFKKSVQSNVGSPNLSIKSSGGEKSEDELYSI